jgi:hypothetical protein
MALFRLLRQLFVTLVNAVVYVNLSSVLTDRKSLVVVDLARNAVTRGTAYGANAYDQVGVSPTSTGKSPCRSDSGLFACYTASGMGTAE